MTDTIGTVLTVVGLLILLWSAWKSIQSILWFKLDIPEDLAADFFGSEEEQEEYKLNLQIRRMLFWFIVGGGGLALIIAGSMMLHTLR